MANLATHLRAHLIAQNLVRDPRVAGAKPPMWDHPPDGVPAPGEGVGDEIGPNLVVGAYLNGGIPTPPFGNFERTDTIDVHIRATDPDLANQLEAAMAAAVIDRRGWVMDGVFVLESEQWRKLQLLESTPQAFTYTTAYLFQTYTP